MDDNTLELARKLNRDISKYQDFISSLTTMIEYNNSRRFRIKYWFKNTFRINCQRDDIITDSIQIPLEIAEGINIKKELENKGFFRWQ